MILYIFKWVFCLGILLAFYHLLLEKEKMHRFNRFYLLGSVLISALIPLIPIEVQPNMTTNAIEATQVNLIGEQALAQNATFDWSILLLSIYILISMVLLTRFFSNILKLVLKAKKNTSTTLQGATLVLVEDNILPHSFWNYIYVNKQQFENNEIEEELFTHELTHVRQKHTFDVLLLEVLHVLFWFNPLIFWLKKTIQLNHEFLADEYVISSYNNIPKYQYLLLDKAAWNNTYYLASNLNYSLTKKRLLKMKTHNSKTTEIFKKIAVLPLLAGLVFLFANKVEAQEKKKKPVVIEVKEVQRSASKAEMNEYNKLLKSSSDNNIYKQKDVEKMIYIYNKMSAKQKASVKNIRDFVPPPPPKPVKIKVVEKTKKSPKMAKKVKEVKVVKEKKHEKHEKEHEHEEEIEIKVSPEVEIEIHEELEDEHEHEKEVEEIIIEEKEDHNDKDEINRLLNDKNITYYINGKKVSNKKAKKLKPENIKKIDVVKTDNGKKGKIYIYTK